MIQQVDHWLRDVGGGIGGQPQDQGDQRRNRGDSRKPEKKGDSGKRGGSPSPNLEQQLGQRGDHHQGDQHLGDHNLRDHHLGDHHLGQRGDPAGTRDPEPPPVSSAVRINGDFSDVLHFYFLFPSLFKIINIVLIITMTIFDIISLIFDIHQEAKA